MSTPNHSARQSAQSRTTVEELFRDVPPIQSIEDLAAPGVFETDTELDEFLKLVRAERDAELA